MNDIIHTRTSFAFREVYTIFGKSAIIKNNNVFLKIASFSS